MADQTNVSFFIAYFLFNHILYRFLNLNFRHQRNSKEPDRKGDLEVPADQVIWGSLDDINFYNSNIIQFI